MEPSATPHRHHPGTASPLLRSKLRRPAVPDYFIERPRLDAVFASVTSRPLTVVIAPAGSGKTQLLSSWVRGGSVTSSWLSLETMDDDPVGLWTGVIASLEEIAPGCGRGATQLIVGGAPADEVVRSLLNDLEGLEADHAVLVLDDVHHIAEPTTVRSLVLFLQHLPAWLHVVAATRTDPPIPLDRLRGRGLLAELRFADLRFTPDETREVMARMAPTLSEDALEASTALTDGWVAGVQLAALATRSAEILAPDASPASRALTEDYVRHEVLATGDPVVVDLLLCVSVIDRVNGPLAAAISGRLDAHELLLTGEAQGLFVHRLGTDGWFRIHPLVREALYGELVRTDRHREHHGRAAIWLEHAGETVSALDQWLLAGQPREALRLLAARSTELYDQGREAVIGRTLEAIPREVTVSDLSALIDTAVSRILGPLPDFVATVDEATWHAERSTEEHSGSIGALQSIALVMSGSWQIGGERAHHSLAALADDWRTDPAGRFAWNTAARALALSERWDDDDPLVVAATIAMSRDPLRGMSLEGVRALGHALAGRPIDALRVGGGIRSAAETMSILRVELALADATARLEIGDRERATETLRALADDEGQPRLFAPIAALLTLAELAQADGDADAASGLVHRARNLITSTVDASPDLHGWIARSAATTALARGEVDEARRCADELHDPFWGPVCRAKLALTLGDPPTAARDLALAEPRCVRHRVVLGLLLARATTGPDDVLAHVTPAMELASEHGMLRTVIVEGSELMDVIERAAWRVPDEWLHRVRLGMAPSTLPLPGPLPGTPELLTDRERDVLRLLPSRLTLTEIASELYVSVNTIKFHLRIIYRKLGVNSRDEAASLARSMARVAPSGRS